MKLVKTLKEKSAAVSAFVKDGVWECDVDSFAALKRSGYQGVRFFSTAVFGFLNHRCGLHAAGLTYFSMLAFVPVLCLLLVFAKTCGADRFAREKINEHIDSFITSVENGQGEAEKKAAEKAKTAPTTAAEDQKDRETERKAEATKELARQIRTFSNDLFDRIGKFDARKIGIVGLFMLMWTVVSTFGQVETAFNEIWEVEKARPIWKRFYLYLFVALVLPVLATLAMSMPILRIVKASLDATLGATSYTKWMGDALVAVLDSRLFGFFFTLCFASIAYAFILQLMPNRKVHLRPALESGVVTALLSGGWMKLCTSAGVGIAKSSALYGSFAAVPILLAWVYMSWQIVLLGGCMTYALQCVHSRSRLCDCK